MIRTAVSLIAAAGLVAGMSACTTGHSASTSGSGNDQLKLQFPGPPVSMNPALAANGGSTVFVSLAYDPLIFRTPEGKLVPDLATSWKFTDHKHEVFELTLRKGVKFSDGSTLDSKAVKASMEYFLDAGGSQVDQVGDIASIDAVDPSTVRINYDKPYPEAAASLDQYRMIGNIIGPKGLKDPKSLLHSSDGTGPFVYAPQKSVTNSHYVYEKNQHYWKPKVQLFESVSIKIISDPNAVLSAVRTGQVDYASGGVSTVAAAKAAGVKLVKAPFFNWCLYLADTKGVVNPALRKKKVRDAIALSIDRSSIAHGVVGQYGEPNGQPMNKGTKGYVPNSGYGHNIKKAKRLMTEAGYPNGFNLTIVTQTSLDSHTRISQAIANSIEKLGIKVKLKVFSTVPHFIKKAETKKYPAVIFPVTGPTMARVYTSQLDGLRNPFGNHDPKLKELYSKSLKSSDAERLDIYKKMTKRMIADARVVPVFTQDNIFYVGKDIDNVKATALNANPLPTGPKKKYEWQPAS